MLILQMPMPKEAQLNILRMNRGEWDVIHRLLPPPGKSELRQLSWITHRASQLLGH